jgi:signal peptidase II
MLRLGLGVALAVAVLDRLSKVLMLSLFEEVGEAIEVTSFLNLVMVWNPGVSFGLLQSWSPFMPWLLSALSGAIVGGLVWWLAKAKGRWLSGALGLVIGGAVGNVIDRLWYGAVADFIDFHLAGHHWPAFNVADTAIVVGVAVLVLDALFADRERPKKGS